MYFLIHRKLWLGCFNSPHLGILGESLVFPPALPGAPVLGRDFLRAGGDAGAEDAAAAAPGGADSAREGGAAAAGPWRVARCRPLGRKLLASAGAAGAPSPGRGRLPGLPVWTARPDPAAAAGGPGVLTPPPPPRLS